MQIWVNRNDPTAAVLCGPVLQLKRPADFATGLDQHRPGQVGDFTGAQASFDRQQDQHFVANRMPGLTREDQQVFNIFEPIKSWRACRSCDDIQTTKIDCKLFE